MKIDSSQLVKIHLVVLVLGSHQGVWHQGGQGGGGGRGGGAVGARPRGAQGGPGPLHHLRPVGGHHVGAHLEQRQEGCHLEITF